MERNNDSDYTRTTPDYEPNFILREPEGGSAMDDSPRTAIDPLKAEADETRSEVAKATDASASIDALGETAGEAASETVVETKNETADEPIKSLADIFEEADFPPEAQDETAAAAGISTQDEADIFDRIDKAIRATEVADASAASDETQADTAKEAEPGYRERGIGANGPQAQHTIVRSSYSAQSADSAESADPMQALPSTETTSSSESAHPDESVRPADLTHPAESLRSDGPDMAATGELPHVRKDGVPASSRPLYENPSFDSGDDKGFYTDPRINFRSRSAASKSSSASASADHGRTAGAGASASADHGRTAGNGSFNRETISGGIAADTENGRIPSGKKAKRKSKPVTMSRKALAFLIVGCLLLSSLFGFGGAMVGYNLYDSYNRELQSSNDTPATEASTKTTGYSLESATGSNLSVKDITTVARNSVVEIRTEGVVSDSWMQEYVTEGAGSGVIISEDGFIMTNNHVISGAKKISVTTSDEKEYDAKLIGADENNDVAVIKIDASGLKAATYGNSDELEVGDLAVAIGNPLGELGGTVTAGIISAKDRALSIDGKTLHLLQTDSSINPGNSGGGLFNDSGQLIGLVVAKSAGSDVEGLGFAIPVNTAANVAQQLMDKGYVSGQPSTGMTYQERSASGGSGTFDSIFGGTSMTHVYIYSVNGDNAKKAGFKSGDIVLAVDGEEITSFDDLSAIVTSHKVGDTLTFTISRDGSEKKIKLQLEEKKVSTNSASGQSKGNGSYDADDEDSDGDGGDEESEYPAVPEHEGGSLFDYFFGW